MENFMFCAMYQNIERKQKSQVTFLTPELRMEWNSLIQPHLDYACLAWYPNLNVKLKKYYK